MMKSVRYLALTMTIAAMSVPVAAQDAPTVTTLSLEDALSISSQYNPQHRQLLNDTRSQGWAVRNSFAAFLPSASANFSLGYSGPGASRFATTEFTQPAVKSSSYGVNLNWFLSGNTLMQPGLQRARLNAAQASSENSRIAMFSATIQQYLAVLQAQEQVDLAQSQYESNDETVRLTQARREAGAATLLEVRQAEVQRGRAQVALLNWQQSVRVEKLRLFQQLGISAPANLESVSLTTEFAIVEPTWNVDELVEQAMRNNPDLVAARARESAADWGVRAATATWYPSVNFSAGWSGFTQSIVDSDIALANAEAGVANSRASCERSNTLAGVVNTVDPTAGFQTNDCSQIVFDPAQALALNNTWPFSFTNSPFSARVTFSIPIFNNFQRPLQVSQASVQRDDAREVVRARELQLVTDVSQQYYATANAYQTIEIQQTNREAAGDALTLARERYRLGAETFVNLLAAQVAQSQAEFDYVRAVYDYHRALANLEAAVGAQMR